MKRLSAILFVLAIPVTVFILLFSGPHMKNNPSFRKFEAVYNLPPEDAVPFKKNDPEIQSFKPHSGLQAGKVFYGYYCIFCHGEDGKGNGPVGQSYVPKPANLTNIYYKSYDSAMLYRSSFTGTGHSPVLDRIISPEWKNYIIIYIKNEFIK